ncbi:DUF2934 domain-containing protein [Amaricoccus sp.]|uniref:DUF2934 domain-containing protein n=1 Tax=Amaricoccus sp. TaxID=1872485 RepID=UPI001B74A310|nr:DUF2934 domain-containing protein [Amaricoccus sp.]MBP7002700.1 DUF2934 domain-containing protein [Amaricoccus sp.]
MTPADTSRTDEIARVAHAVRDAEGRPDGRDHDHWMRAKQIVEEGRGGEYAGADEGDPSHAARAVQPGFEDAAPGMVPGMKRDPAPELKEDAGGRFAQQLADLPEG